jgi:hypothetical protein
MKKKISFSQILLIVFLPVCMGIAVVVIINRNRSNDIRGRAANTTVAEFSFDTQDQLASWTYHGPQVSVIPAANGIPAYTGNMLKISYPSIKQGVLFEHSLPSLMTNMSYTVHYYDPGPSTNQAIQFRVSNAINHEEFLAGVYTQNVPNTYMVRPGGSTYPFFNTGITRTKGWHAFEIRVTPVGTYAVIDGKNTSYLPMIKNIMPINERLTTASTYGMATTWNATGEYYIDAVEVKTTSSYSSQNDLLIKMVTEFLANRPVSYFDTVSTKSVDAPTGTVLYILTSDHVRDMANYFLATAFSCRYLEHYSPSCITKSVSLLHSLLKKENFSNWKSGRAHGVGFSYPNAFKNVPAPLIDTPLLLGAWILWDKIPNTTTYPLQQLTISRLTSEAQFWLGDPSLLFYPSQPGNTNTEETAWTASFLSLAGNMMNKPDWIQKAAVLMNMSLEKSPIPGNTTNALGNQNVSDPSFTLYNHYMVHPGYALYVLSSLSEALLGYKLTGKPYTGVLNQSNLTQYAKANIDTLVNLNSFRFQSPAFGRKDFGGKDDWKNDPSTISQSAFTLLSKSGLTQYTDRINALSQFQYYTNRFSIFPYNLAANEIVKPQEPTFPSETENRFLIESIHMLYTITAYLWQSNAQLPAVQ